MKIKVDELKKIILEEQTRLEEDLKKDEESKIAHTAYLMLSDIRKRFEEYMGDLPEGEEPSEDFERMFDAVANAWRSTDKILTGGETRDQLPGIFENKVDEVQINKPTKEIAKASLQMVRDLSEIVNDLVPAIQEIADRESFGGADINPEKIKVRPGTFEVPRLKEEEDEQ